MEVSLSADLMGFILECNFSVDAVKVHSLGNRTSNAINRIRRAGYKLQNSNIFVLDK